MRSRLLFVVFAISFGVFASEKEPVPVLDFYPACDYQVFENVKVRRSVRSKNGLVVIEVQREKAKEIVEQIAAMASEKNADAIILTAREFKSPAKRGHAKLASSHFELSYTADLIDGCQSPLILTSKLTPYNHNGDKQVDLGTLSVAAKRFEVPTKKQQVDPGPELTSTDVSLASGVSGVKIGNSVEQVKDKFGQPSVNIQLDKNFKVWGYGRGLWLVFEQGKLVNLSNKQAFLSQELINLIPVIEQLDFANWSINGQFSVGDLIAENAKSAFTDENSMIRLLSEDLGEEMHILGFEYSRQGFRQSDVIALLPTQRKSEPISHAVQEAELPGITAKAMAKIELTSNRTVYFLDPFTSIEVKNDSLRQIVLSDSIFSHGNLPQEHNWRFENFYQGQGISEAREDVPLNSIELNDTIQITSDNHLQKLFFFETDSAMQLYRIEVTVF